MTEQCPYCKKPIKVKDCTGKCYKSELLQETIDELILKNRELIRQLKQ